MSDQTRNNNARNDASTDAPHDVAIIGGSYAGLAAATLLARAHRRVLVLDAGLPRNRFASHAHGVLGHDGRPGADILADARSQLLRYPTAEWQGADIVRIDGEDGRFAAHAADGRTWFARKLLLATGVTDMLPDLPGARERWGRTVLHCPYCHGYEISPGPIGVMAPAAHVQHYASLIADWGDVVLFANGEAVADPELLAARGVRIEPGPVAGLVGEAPALDGMRLADGRFVPLRALFLASRIAPSGPLPAMLGCATEDTPLGSMLRTDAQKQTTRAGVYAAGDIALMRSNITLATADGVTAGFSLHQALIADALGALSAPH